MIRPWHLAGTYPELVIEFGDLPPGQLGRTCVTTNTITLQRGMRQRQRRAVLMHEVLHFLRGGVEDCDRLEGIEEREVERLAAVLLMPTRRMVDALLWSQDEHELADYFHIDVYTVRDRLRHMTEAEKVAIEAALRLRGAFS